MCWWNPSSPDTPTAPATSARFQAVTVPVPPPSDDSAHRPGDEPRSNARIAGTPAYMAPEQHRHSPADQRSDQFSFCVTLYTALYGRHPFAGGSLLELVINLTDGKLHPPPPGTPVPAAVHAAILRGLAPLPEQRWPTLAALLDALEIGSGRDRDPEFDLSVAKRQRVVLAGIIATSILGLSVVVILGSPQQDMLPTAVMNAVAGGIINTVTKSGGNEFHGSLRDNLTNQSWNSKNEFSPEPEDKVVPAAGHGAADRRSGFLGIGRAGSRHGDGDAADGQSREMEIPHELNPRKKARKS